MPRAPAAAVALALAFACVRAPVPGPAGAPPPASPPVRFRAEDVPAQLHPALVRVEAAEKALRDQLAARMASELAAGGVVRALSVCQRDAPAFAAAVSAQTGVEVGRVAARPRHGAPPRAWMAPLLEELATRRAADVHAVVLDLGDRLALLRPIAVGAACLACHGSPDRVLPEVKIASDGGPTAYAEGDLRG
ncbi:MAG TPA: DUF3365 domain-containing protein, partial [Anaeromyxobacter sp.]|nr:DUF3365 domain-containing protein [Anaeromyxobacter sp.]